MWGIILALCRFDYGVVLPLQRKNTSACKFIVIYSHTAMMCSKEIGTKHIEKLKQAMDDIFFVE